MTTFLARRTQLHQNHLVANVRAGDMETLALLKGLHAHFVATGTDAVTASQKALAAVYGMVQRHAGMLAFVEAFWVMGVLFLAMLPFLLLLQYSKRGRKSAEEAAKPRQIATEAGPIQREELPQYVGHTPTEAEIHDLVLH